MARQGMICANELYRNCLATSAGHKIWVILWFITGIQHKLRNYSAVGNIYQLEYATALVKLILLDLHYRWYTKGRRPTGGRSF